MQLFYCPNIPQNQALDPTESKHCLQVLRHKTGDLLKVIDGKGGFYTVEITHTTNQICHFNIIEQNLNYDVPTHALHIAIAPLKNTERFEWFLEKSVEIGITDITPIITQRTEKANLRPERLQKIMVAAMKQTLKAYLPILHPPINFKLFLQQKQIKQQHTPNKFIGYINPESTHLKNVFFKQTDTLMLIGPEGDFTQNEVQLALENNFKPVSLGHNILRTETAGIYVCSLFNILNS